MLKVFFTCFIYVGISLDYVRGDCAITARSDIRFFENFGTHDVEIRKHNGGVLTLNRKASINVTCTTHLNIETYNGYNVKFKSLDQRIAFVCNDNNELEFQRDVDTTFEELHAAAAHLTCERPKRYLFESYNVSWPNCKPYTTYSVGRSDPDFAKTMGFCYDFEKLELKFANYRAYWATAYKKGLHEPEEYLLVQQNKLVTSLKTYFDFMSPETFNDTLHTMKSKDAVLSMYDFDFVNLIQDATMQQYIHDFDYILNTVWWRNLRVGNWKFYLDALYERTQTQDYFVYTGTSGVIEVPAVGVNKSESLVIRSDNTKVRAPEYIWSYLQSLDEPDSKQEELVVIGYNSPFYQHKSEIMFCEDICDQFDWVKQSLFGRVRLMPTLGVVFCCRPEDVQKRFHPFPLKPVLHPQQKRTWENTISGLASLLFPFSY